MRVKDGDRYAVVASLGGAPKNPVWYWNIAADPHVSLQDGPELRDYVAHEASGEEKKQWWSTATEVWPDYDNYQSKTDREIPLFVLEPAS
jgi:deazaflavin-dependent oxidoreductase (nitroreductase family)